MNPVRSSFHSPQTPSIGRALLVWTLRDAPAALLDEVFEHDLEMRDRFLQDWSGEDLLVAAAWEQAWNSRALKLLESFLGRLTEHGEQDVHWYALRPARFGDSMYAVYYVNFDVTMMPESFAHQGDCWCALCCRKDMRVGSAIDVLEIVSTSVM
ncbi:MAG: hypothetical protein M3458_14640 [Acidobacteriota bacterium]|nr:hypothetical protein [Acidobacteriota bacterium]